MSVLLFALSFSFYCSYCLGVGLYGHGGGYNGLKKELERQQFSERSEITTKWIEQKIDNFDSSDERTWKMRYFERTDLWKDNGPIYLFIGGEGTADPRFLNGGIIAELANDTNGAMFMSEHRYYGKSMPLPNKGVENLKYLNAKQALADLAYLIQTLKSNPQFKQSKVVAIGGSYPGNLAAWFKLIYPDLVDAAIASSAPVLAKRDFYEYLETVSDDYEQYGTEACHDYIRDKFKYYDEAFKTYEGIEKLKKEERICEESDMTKEENIYLFFDFKASTFMVRAQYGSESILKAHCNKIMNNSRKIAHDEEDDLNYNFWNSKKNCYHIDFDEDMETIKEGGWINSWIYQVCNEFSYAQTTTSKDQPFKNIPVEMYYRMCYKLYEVTEDDMDRSVDETNEYFGGLNPNVTEVVFVNGELDPWHRLGVLDEVFYNAPTVFIPRSSHCRDLFSNRKEDPQELVDARAHIKYLIKKWIGFGDYK